MVGATGVGEDTPHAPLPSDDTAGAWVDYGNRESGQLDIANEDKRALRGIGETCERWQAEAVKKTTKKAWWDVL